MERQVSDTSGSLVSTQEWTRLVRLCTILTGSKDAADSTFIIHLEGLVLILPEGRQFWQTHSRIRTLPKQYIEVDGRFAVVTSFESVINNARLDVVSAYDTYEVLHIYGGCA